MESVLFDREKIYEKLEIAPKPENYGGKIPWVVQQQIAATNGIHFKDSVGYLKEYPIPPIPVGEEKLRAASYEPREEKTNGPATFLDIGCGWGRWLVAASRKNYLPVGVDIRLEFCETARAVLQDNGFHGYTVVGDLKKLPFQANVFDVVWSFSVIQHTHYDRLLGCIEGIQRVLKSGTGYCYLEFPNKNGLHNRFGPARKYKETGKDYDSWDVRYYTPGEYRKIFGRYFGNFKYVNHSALGIGVLPGDAQYARGFKNKSGIWLSRGLSKLFETVTPLKAFSDSIYIQCYKDGAAGASAGAGLDGKRGPDPGSGLESGSGLGLAPETGADPLTGFFAAHRADPGNNLNLVNLLRCPVSGGRLVRSEDGQELISEKARIAYPVRNQIPIMIPGEARSL